MADWTPDTIAARLAEASETSQRLPPASVRGYVNCWPEIIRAPWEVLASEDRRPHRFPPSPAAIDRMLETIGWMSWLPEDQRRLLWMRARRCPWREVCACFGIDRTTGWRRWQAGLVVLSERLNATRPQK